MKRITPAELRTLLKNAGFKANQVTVRKSSSETYLNVIVRDPKVNIADVEAVTNPHHTWQMDVTDYVTGQAVHAEYTREALDAIAAPYLDAVTDAVRKFESCPDATHGEGIGDTGAVLFLNHHNGNAMVSFRGTWLVRNFWSYDLKQMTDWALLAVAREIALAVMRESRKVEETPAPANEQPEAAPVVEAVATVEPDADALPVNVITLPLTVFRRREPAKAPAPAATDKTPFAFPIY